MDGYEQATTTLSRETSRSRLVGRGSEVKLRGMTDDDTNTTGGLVLWPLRGPWGLVWMFKSREGVHVRPRGQPDNWLVVVCLCKKPWRLLMDWSNVDIPKVG